jgi:hypothetical protein
MTFNNFIRLMWNERIITLTIIEILYQKWLKSQGLRSNPLNLKEDVKEALPNIFQAGYLVVE